MDIQTSTTQGVCILRPSGKIALGNGDQELGEAVRTQLAAGARKILIDFSQVSYMDSSGIGELVGCYTSIRNRQGELKLCGMNARTFDLMKVTSLNSVFDVQATEAEALALWTLGS
jgi:anti-anti-sigma factor